MEKIRDNSFIHMLIKSRNPAFLVICLLVHLGGALVCGLAGFIPVFVLNVISSVCYIIFLYFFHKVKNPDVIIAMAYIEIIIFSLLNEAFMGKDHGYIWYIAGMTVLIFFLVPSFKRQRVYLQLVGGVSTLLIFFINESGFTFFPELTRQVEPYAGILRCFNLILGLFSIIYLSFLHTMESEETREKLDYSINHDPLTGLYNRRFYRNFMEKEQEKIYAIAMVDIDNFKVCNDTYGHSVGDKVLEAVAGTIRESLDEKDVPVRWGGEEFVIYLPSHDETQAVAVAERIRRGIAETSVVTETNEIHITATLGVAVGENISVYEKVIASADEKLYTGKHQGKNQVVA